MLFASESRELLVLFHTYQYLHLQIFIFDACQGYPLVIVIKIWFISPHFSYLAMLNLAVILVFCKVYEALSMKLS
jgi:hypothetical protein